MLLHALQLSLPPRQPLALPSCLPLGCLPCRLPAPSSCPKLWLLWLCSHSAGPHWLPSISVSTSCTALPTAEPPARSSCCRAACFPLSPAAPAWLPPGHSARQQHWPAALRRRMRQWEAEAACVSSLQKRVCSMRCSLTSLVADLDLVGQELLKGRDLHDLRQQNSGSRKHEQQQLLCWRSVRLNGSAAGSISICRCCIQ